MNLKDILKPAGAILGFIHPALGAAINGVNALLPENDKLPETATADEVLTKIETMPPQQQAEVMMMQISVEKDEIKSEVDRVSVMVKADQQSTRPLIAKLMAIYVGFIILLFSGILIYAISVKMDISGWWPIFGAMMACPAEVLRYYFGVLRDEQSNRYGIPKKSLLEVIRGK